MGCKYLKLRHLKVSRSRRRRWHPACLVERRGTSFGRRKRPLKPILETPPRSGSPSTESASIDPSSGSPLREHQPPAESRAAYLRTLGRRLALLAREVESLAGGASNTESVGDRAEELLAEIAGLGRELATVEAGGDEGWSAVRERLQGRWSKLRRSFEELAISANRRYGTDSGQSGGGPRW